MRLLEGSREDLHAWATQEQKGGESLKLENQGGTYLQRSSSGWTMGGGCL